MPTTAQAQSESSQLSFFEIRVPKSSETSPEAMAACFQGLPLPKSSFWDFLVKNHYSLSFEIVTWSQRIYFMVAVPTKLASYFTSQLVAQYPQALILPVADYMTHLFPKNLTAKEQLKLATLGKIVMEAPFYLPLKTYKDFSDIDPLSTILGALSKTHPDDKIILQYIVTKAPNNWQQEGYHIAQKTFATSDPTKVIPNPQKTLIEQKIAQVGLTTSIRILIVGSDPYRRDSLLHQIAGSFSSVAHGEANKLKLSKPLPLTKGRLLSQIENRTLDFASRSHVLSAAELATIYHLPNQSLINIRNIAWGGTLKGEPPENLPIAQNMVEEEKQDVNFFARTEFKNQETVFGIKRADRRKHTYIIGKTGTGKSTLIANMAINDMRNGEGVCVIDPHGDLCDIILDYIPKNRINDVIYLDPNNADSPFRINPLEVTNPEQAELVASGIVAIFHKLFAYSWGPRLEYILRNTILSLTHYPNSTLLEVPRILTNQSFRNKVVERIPDEMLKRFWIEEFNQLDQRARNEAISPILNKVGQFTTFPKIRAILERPKSSVSIEDAMDSGKIMILNLSQGKIGEDNAALLGAMMITRIQLAAMSRVNVPEEQRKDFYLYVDEFQNFATSSFVKILSEARKYRLNLVVANQYRAQVPEEVQKAIFGNVGSLISFLVGAEDAAVLKTEFGQTYEETDLVNLNNFEIVLKLSIDNKTSPPFPAKTLPLPYSKNQNREKVIRISTERYGKPNKEVASDRQEAANFEYNDNYVSNVYPNQYQNNNNQSRKKQEDRPIHIKPLIKASAHRTAAEEALVKLGIQPQVNSKVNNAEQPKKNKLESTSYQPKTDKEKQPYKKTGSKFDNNQQIKSQGPSTNRPRFIVEEVKD
ncbi:hypothetical protein COX08_02420 [Candidatus Beckwithbacteria bacterium CG23_combo_of_CG06-09_8_20_14_all_34_8]|uniref:Uncharacterized protein n=1 Tax=Candidatus Beckwithbacteria bacterium CG23_combo_of_CG06-09_8_20_14_all_34_8 TaxID=1974497 RepID=A0A2H0B6A1_9BACT|nr:MAG: hypothetical protein COX08_02420 [Candidatus Beckwithbacteria bacterium CG23_combo_of_CG06-09_8_20_14_all_34_8]